MDANNSDAFYKKLKDQLADTSVWPAKYMYKFIVPSLPEKVDKISKIFDGLGAIIENKVSSKGTYTSISIRVTMSSPEAVIDKYKEVGEIEGVISL
ncbi:hypothetical protein BST92_12935 [Nonlabens arenilitoris]|uniref:DUF493 domain-containing protein n=1 Tax=Nonlabens arenilitoris TaxID=1217969 RepID=A0A2S7UCU2_9FLAO|nr:DUF493 family protein [Nonlabens arenilitoris]PQJ32766.1 hypothetical protein BST92_12935 [Nonlabens arenilitoris]